MSLITTIQQVVTAAIDEMDYRYAPNDHGEDIPQPIPCQLRLIDDPRQDTQRFHDALDERGIYVHGTVNQNDRRDRSNAPPYYDGHVLLPSVNTLRIAVYRSGLTQIYPIDEYIPTYAELTDVIEALSEGFHADVVHEPIEGHVVVSSK